MSSSKDFDAILLVAPASIVYVNERHESFLGVEGRSLKSKQTIRLEVFDQKYMKRSLWKADMNMNINFSNSKLYAPIAVKIIERLKNNQLISNNLVYN